MEVSQKIHFWYQILLKIMIFWQNTKKKNMFLIRILGQPTKKTLLKVKNAEIAWKSC